MGRKDLIPAVVSYESSGWWVMRGLTFVEDVVMKNGDVLIISDELFDEEDGTLVEVTVERAEEVHGEGVSSSI